MSAYINCFKYADNDLCKVQCSRMEPCDQGRDGEGVSAQTVLGSGPALYMQMPHVFHVLLDKD